MAARTPDPESNVVDRLTARFGTQVELAKVAECTQSTISDRARQNLGFTHRQMLAILKNAPDRVSPADFFVVPQRNDRAA